MDLLFSIFCFTLFPFNSTWFFTVAYVVSCDSCTKLYNKCINDFMGMGIDAAVNSGCKSVDRRSYQINCLVMATCRPICLYVSLKTTKRGQIKNIFAVLYE